MRSLSTDLDRNSFEDFGLLEIFIMTLSFSSNFSFCFFLNYIITFLTIFFDITIHIYTVPLFTHRHTHMFAPKCIYIHAHVNALVLICIYIVAPKYVHQKTGVLLALYNYHKPRALNIILQ